jgi:hypothetical protein
LYANSVDGFIILRWFVEFWKRRQAVLQYEWVSKLIKMKSNFFLLYSKDSIDFEAHLEPIRPAFENQAKTKGEERINPVTEVLLFFYAYKFIHRFIQIKEPYVSTRKRVPFFLIAAAVVLLMVNDNSSF